MVGMLEFMSNPKIVREMAQGVVDNRSVRDKHAEIAKQKEAWADNLEIGNVNDPFNATTVEGLKTNRGDFLKDVIDKYVSSFHEGHGLDESSLRGLRKLLDKGGVLWQKMGVEEKDQSFTKSAIIKGKNTIVKDSEKIARLAERLDLRSAQDQLDVLEQLNPKIAAKLKDTANATAKAFSRYRINPSSMWRSAFHRIERGKSKPGSHSSRGAFDLNVITDMSDPKSKPQKITKLRKESEKDPETKLGKISSYQQSMIDLLDSSPESNRLDDPHGFYVINESVDYSDGSKTGGLNHLHINPDSNANQKLYHAIRTGGSSVYSLGAFYRKQGDEEKKFHPESQAMYMKNLPVSDFPILKHIYDNKASTEQKARIEQTIMNLPGSYKTRKKQLLRLLGISGAGSFVLK